MKWRLLPSWGLKDPTLLGNSPPCGCQGLIFSDHSQSLAQKSPNTPLFEELTDTPARLNTGYYPQAVTQHQSHGFCPTLRCAQPQIRCWGCVQSMKVNHGRNRRPKRRRISRPPLAEPRPILNHLPVLRPRRGRRIQHPIRIPLLPNPQQLRIHLLPPKLVLPVIQQRVGLHMDTDQHHPSSSSP